MTRNLRWRRRGAAFLTTTALAGLLVAGAATVSWADDDVAPADASAAPVVPVPVPAEPTPAEPAAAPVEPVVPESVAPEPVAPEPAPAEPAAVEPAPVAPTATRAVGPTAGAGDPQEPKPDVTVSVPTNGRFAWFDETVPVTIRAVSRTGDIDSITWSTSGAQVGEAVVAGGVATLQVSAEGTTVITATAIDSDGNGSDVVTRTVKVDQTDPTAARISPTTNALRVDEVFQADVDCSDALAGIEQCYLRIGNYTVSTGFRGSIPRAGVFPVFASAIDNAGNFIEVPAGSMRVVEDDVDAPTVTVKAPAVPATGWYTAPVTVRFEADDAAGSGVDYVEYRADQGSGQWSTWTRVPGDFAAAVLSRDGTTHYEARAADAFGNLSDVTPSAFALDATKPVIEVTGPADGIEVDRDADLRLTYTCSDAGSGIAECGGTRPSGGRLDTSEPGTYEFRVTAVDVAGNISEVVRSYTVTSPDEAAPVVTVTAPTVPASGWYTEEPTITLTADDPSGVAELTWDLVNPYGGSSSGTNASGTVEFSDFMDGLTSIRYRATDEAGNQGAQETLLVRLDRNVPWIVVSSPDTHPALIAANHQFEQGDAVQLTFSCGDSASGLVSCLSSTGTVLPTASLGEQSVTITATDRAGLVQVEQLTYTVIAAEPQPQPGTGSGKPDTADAEVLALTGNDPLPWLLVAAGLLLTGAIATASVLVSMRR